jgi:hypothetical protein
MLMTEEPSVLDFVKSLLTPWKGAPLKIPRPEPERPAQVEEAEQTPVAGAPLEAEGLVAEEQEIEQSWMRPPTRQVGSSLEKRRLESIGVQETVSPGVKWAPEGPPLAPEPEFTVVQAEEAAGVWPWRALIALGLALLAQRALASGPVRTYETGVLLYLIAAAWLVWSEMRAEWRMPAYPADSFKPDRIVVGQVGVIVGIGLALFTFLASGGNRFSTFNIFLETASLAAFVSAFWVRAPQVGLWRKRLQAWLSQPRWQLSVSRWAVFTLAVVALVLFFRFYRLDQVPPEMVSDHAEKYLDVADILNGQPHIFFPRNSGREALQFYLITLLLKLGGQISFDTLKLSTTLIGALALPFVYLLGKELGNRRVALFSLALFGVSYWTNVVARAGMRLPFYFLFTAATLFFLVRGLRTSNRNYIIVSGIVLGLGFYGYSADRILPLVVALALGLYALHSRSNLQRQQAVWYLALVGLFALVVFVPLLRYAIEEPEAYAFRTLTRMGSMEQPLPGPAWKIFLSNLGNALAMFAWADGEVWVVSIPQIPALGVVAGALFHLGAVLLLVRYLRRRQWQDLFLLLIIPLLMMPSILSLAFPHENPNLYRAGGAAVPVFLIAALTLDGLISALQARWRAPWGSRLGWGVAIFLLVWAALQDYDLVFNQYARSYRLSAWNTSEIGAVIRSFVATVGDPDSAYVVAYPHWVDTRLVAINAGYPNRDFALWPEHFQDTLVNPNPKLFIIFSIDQASIEALRELYPQGHLRLHQSQVEGKNFWLYMVLPEDGGMSERQSAHITP